MPTETKECVICGTPFQTRHAHVMACSRQCGLKLRSQRKAARKALEPPIPEGTTWEPRGLPRPCEICGKPFRNKPHVRTCSKKCGYELRARVHPWQAKKPPRPRKHKSPGKGRSVNRGGYVVIYVPPDERELVGSWGAQFSEHRYVMAKHLGRPIAKHESVHHKNGNRADNRLENLELRVSNHGHGATEAHCATCTCFD